tara:strand:+ start:332 stop:1540 length:1209 start_codon:yes stop_codon:yes gene_type:complete
MKNKYNIYLLLAFLTTCTPLLSVDWADFRGPDGNPVHDGSLPLNWDVKNNTNVAWRTSLPGRGVSSPIVVGDLVVVTASGGSKQQRLFVLGFDQTSGKQRWKRSFWATGRTYTHPTSSNAAPSPVSDGEYIYAFYSSNDLVCLDLDGNLMWYRGLAHDYPKAGNDVGMASSPAIAGDVVIVQIENQGDSFASGIDRITGEELWRVPRDPRANWSSPVAYKETDGSYTVLLQSPSGLNAVEAKTGNEKWTKDLSCGNITSPLKIDDAIYFGAGGTTKLKLNETGTTPETLWNANRLTANAASPIVDGDKLYIVSGSIVKCADSSNGDLLWQVRLKGRFWATPILSNGHLYTFNQDGLVQIVKTGEEGEIVAEFEVGEPVLGTPAAANNALFFRSDSTLWKISK